jgi:hypothetical protein
MIFSGSGSGYGSITLTMYNALYSINTVRVLVQDGGKDDKSVHLSVDPAPPLQETDTDRLQQLLMDETLPLFQRYRAMFSLRNKVNKSRIENNAFLRIQMLWRVEKDIVASDTDRLQQLLMDETLPLFQRYRAMFSLRNKVNESRIQLKRTSSRGFFRGRCSLIPGIFPLKLPDGDTYRVYFLSFQFFYFI